LSFEIRHNSQFQPIIPIALLWRGNPRCFIADGRQDLAVFRPGLGQDILFPTTTTPVAIGDKTDEEFSTLASMWPKASVAQIAARLNRSCSNILKGNQVARKGIFELSSRGETYQSNSTHTTSPK